jgi:peptide deformylase
MALRMIVVEGDETLRKKSKEVKNFGARTHLLLDDMWETMREADGVGLAAPQVGVLRRAIVIDVTEPVRDEQDGDRSGGAAAAVPRENEGEAGSGAGTRHPENEGEAVSSDAGAAAVNTPGGPAYELLNPEIIASEGESRGKEGCLSIPGVSGFVTRPGKVTVRASDRDGNEVVVEAEGMLAKALCHEIDHLNGVLFTDMAEDIEEQGSYDDDSFEEGQ